MTPVILPDLILVALLLIMAWGALHAPARRDAMVLFIAFGVVVALVWARLEAPDLALAEAAIGAGLTGVLLMHAARHLPERKRRVRRRSGYWGALVFAGLASLMFLVHLLYDNTLVEAGLTASTTDYSPRARVMATQAMPDSGVEHPVTAVLLNFRAWDTVLELLVMLLALTGLKQLFRDSASLHAQTTRLSAAWPLMLSWVRLLAPMLVLTGGYLLWRGSSGPGGAFQAGALIAAAAVVLRLTGLLPALRWSSAGIRLTVVAAALFFLTVAVITGFAGEGWLTYPTAYNSTLIVLMELFATLSIAVTLTLLVIGEHEDLRT